MKNNNVLIICDNDKNYCYKLDSYIRENLSIPFNIYGITDTDRLSEFSDRYSNVLLLISQAIFEKTRLHGFKHVLVLREKERVLAEKESLYGYDDVNIRFTDKYQKSENITDNILSMCLDMPEIVVKGISKEPENKTKIVGFYTPAHNINQTAEAKSFARKMDGKEKALYINTDCFCTDELIRNLSYDETISDLMYFAECADDKFGIYLERIVKHDGNLDFIPTCLSPRQGRMIKSGEYEQLFKQISKTEKYNSLVVDISEGIPELFDILRLCDELYVLQENDQDSQQRIDLLINELQRDEEFDLKKLHRVVKSGGGSSGA